jgi:hypothetical protein
VVAAEQGDTSGPPGGIGESDVDVVTPWKGGHSDEEMRTDSQEYNPETNEVCGFMDRECTYDETPSMPAVTDPADTSGPIRDTDEGCLETRPPDSDDGNETTSDANSAGVLSDIPDTTALVEMARTWIGGVRLVMNAWWQALVTTPDDRDTRPYEGYIPSTSYDPQTSESTDDLTSDPPP